MTQMTDDLARTILAGNGCTRWELDQLCNAWLNRRAPEPATTQPSAVSLLREVCEELDGVGCDPCVGSYAPMEDLHGRIVRFLATTQPDAKPEHGVVIPSGTEISVDVSTGDDDAQNRIFAIATGEVMMHAGKPVVLCIEESRNFAKPERSADEVRMDFLEAMFARGGSISADRYGPGTAGCRLFTVPSQHVRGYMLRGAIDATMLANSARQGEE
jgi:hypothetical protein